MDAFIPVAENLHESSLDSASLRAPLSARTDAEQAIIQMEMRLFRHTATAKYTAAEWLDLRDLVEKEDRGIAICFPRHDRIEKR